MKVEALPGPYGVRVTGADLSNADESVVRELAGHLFEQRIVSVGDQQLSPADYVAFGRMWGRPVLLIAARNRHPDHPEIIVQSNSAKVPPPVRNVASHWHCDSSYEEEPSSVTMLLGLKAPETGGETLFADTIAAFEALPAEQGARLETLVVLHAVSANKPAPGETIVRPEDLPPELTEGVAVPPPIVQPLVRRHPVTGRKGLYGLGGSAFAIVGMPARDGQALIADLKQHVTQDRFVQSHKLMPGEILLWDNFSVMHRATPIAYSDAPEEARLNYRISVKGLPPGIAVS
jgi:alpha-ketoglutarate-dependent taurine dioxygenase